MLAVGAVLLAFEGPYSSAAADAVVAVLLGYLYHRFCRNRRKASVHNVNI